MTPYLSDTHSTTVRRSWHSIVDDVWTRCANPDSSSGTSKVTHSLVLTLCGNSPTHKHKSVLETFADVTLLRSD